MPTLNNLHTGSHTFNPSRYAPAYPPLAKEKGRSDERPLLLTKTALSEAVLNFYWKYSFTFSKKPFSFLPGCGVKLSESRSFSKISRSWLLTFLGVHTLR